jgi:hypothetical protein
MDVSSRDTVASRNALRNALRNTIDDTWVTTSTTPDRAQARKGPKPDSLRSTRVRVASTALASPDNSWRQRIGRCDDGTIEGDRGALEAKSPRSNPRSSNSRTTSPTSRALARACPRAAIRRTKRLGRRCGRQRVEQRMEQPTAVQHPKTVDLGRVFRPEAAPDWGRNAVHDRIAQSTARPTGSSKNLARGSQLVPPLRVRFESGPGWRPRMRPLGPGA